MLRQHAARYAAHNMKHDAYRNKRRQIIDGLIAMHGELDPLDSTDPLSVLEEAAAERRATRRRNLTTGIGGLLLALIVGATTPGAQQTWPQLSGTATAPMAQQPQADFQRAAVESAVELAAGPGAADDLQHRAPRFANPLHELRRA